MATPSDYGALGADLARARKRGDLEAEAAIRRRLAITALADRIAAVAAEHSPLTDDDRRLLLQAVVA